MRYTLYESEWSEMRRLDAALHVLLSLIISAREIARLIPCEASARQQVIYARAGNTEARLAAGGRIDLSTAGLFDLSQLEGVSETQAKRLLASRAAVLRRAASLPAGRIEQAYMLVPGIGPKTAAKLARQLTAR